MSLYHFTRIFRSDPGAQAYVFGMEWSLPRFRVLSPGVPVRRGFNVIQPPQAFQNQTVPTSGVGGLIVGGVVFQPLISNPGS